MSRVRITRGLTRAAALVAACGITVPGAVALDAAPAEAVTIYRAADPGYALPWNGHYTWLGAYNNPAGSGLSWCTEIDAIAPSPSNVVSTYEITGDSNMMPLGGEDVALHSSAQMRWILDTYEDVATADSRAAISVIVHLNYDATNQDSWGKYWGMVQSRYPQVAKLVRDYVYQAKAPWAGATPEAKTENKRVGDVHNIGVQNQDGGWVAGIPLTVTLDGPAVFDETGTNTWSGQTPNQPLTLKWHATGNGKVTFKTSFKQAYWVNKIQSSPGKQDMIYRWGDPREVTVPGPSVEAAHVEVRTKAVSAGGDKLVAGLPGEKITDEVCYSGVDAGKEYEVSGRLMNRKSGKEITDQTGKAYTASKTFTPSESEGCVDVEFVVDGRDVVDVPMVVFERLATGGEVVATHEDVNDEDQQLNGAPSVKTTAMGREGTKDIDAKPDQKITDTVCYTSLIAGKEYRLEGVLMDQSTSKPLLDEAKKEITASKTFTPSESEGCVDVEFVVDGRLLTKAPTVVFEDLYQGKRKIAVHADINDEGQTIPPAPEVKTTATDKADGDKFIEPKADQVITDQVCYTGLKPGKAYKLAGTLMDKAANSPLKKADGSDVMAEREFTPSESEGCVDVEFVVDGSLLGGRDLVVFESLLHQGREVALHADINDEGQTVRVTPPPPTLVKTGATAGMFALLACVLMGLGVVTTTTRRKLNA